MLRRRLVFGGVPKESSFDQAWQEVNKQATETAVWVPWSWDEDLLPYSSNAVNAYYQTFTTTIDWVNVGVSQ